MKIEIVPEPAPEEREAIERAVARLPAPAAHDRGGWWRAGVEESLAEPGGDESGPA